VSSSDHGHWEAWKALMTVCHCWIDNIEHVALWVGKKDVILMFKLTQLDLFIIIIILGKN
jgi:hypothetical protein